MNDQNIRYETHNRHKPGAARVAHDSPEALRLLSGLDHQLLVMIESPAAFCRPV